jgi:predicted enzyme related to lactoylglutathione lyase
VSNMDWKLEVVPIPVSDVDRAKCFYAEQVGFVVDLDTRIGDEMRLVQLTPPGSGCSIHVSSGIIDMSPGSIQGLQLVVSDIEAAHGRRCLARGARRTLELLRLLQRSGWQRLGPAGAPCPRLTNAVCKALSGALATEKTTLRSVSARSATRDGGQVSVA